MVEKVLKFGEQYIIENKFHIYKESININKVDIKKNSVV